MMRHSNTQNIYHMLKLAKKFPTVLKDNLKNCHAFREKPRKVIDIDPSIEPFYETRITTTPHHIRAQAEKYIKNLLNKDIREV